MSPRVLLPFFFAFALTAALARANDLEQPARDPTAPGPVEPARFANPPLAVRPWVYYWQLKGNVSKELITRDLENMAEIGVGGLLVFDSRRYWDDYDSKTHVPVPLEIKHEFMSEGWRENMTHLVSEASRLGLQVSFNISDSGGQLRGSWDMKELGPRELIWSEGNLDGPKRVSIELPLPKDKLYCSEVALLAVRIVSPVSENRENVKLNETWSPVALEVGEDAPRFDQVVDLTEQARNGAIEWDVPEGSWKILRFCSARIGEPGCVDVLNAKAVEDYFHKMPETLLDDVGDAAGATLSHFYNVSWEGVHPNWTDGFDDFFESRRGYSIRNYLPVLRGLAPNGDYDPNRFLTDYMLTISDAFCANCYETVGRLCRERGARWHSEDGGPWNRKSPLFHEADMLSFWGQNDFPQGEFWIGAARQTNAPYAAMAARIYGRRDVSLEAFTHMRKHWSVYPALLKPYADASFLAGANLMIWHTYTASPEELGKPGFEYFAGTHVNSNVTWQPYVRPFMDYMARCQLLLRQGRFVSDVCAYVDYKNYVMWGLAEKWNPDSKLALPKGFRYDLLDSKVFETLEYRDGFFVLPGGAKYRLLVFDLVRDAAPVEVVRKLKTLAEKGAPILLGDVAPQRSVALNDWKNADAEVRAIAEYLRRGELENVRVGVDPRRVLDELGVKPDLETEGATQFAHRATDELDLYFLAAPFLDDSTPKECVFRVRDKVPTIWDPLSGRVLKTEFQTLPDGRVKLTPPNKSCFVVFSRPDAFPDAEPIATPRPARKSIAIDGPFDLRFDPTFGGPARATWNALQYWNESDDPGVKFYSGTATYRATFTLDKEDVGRPALLKLGTVRDVARARCNGVDCGIAWTAPFELELVGTKEGENVLEIDVANCWQNRLIGDAALEPEERFCKTNVVLEKSVETPMPPYRGYVSTDPLEPSGLIGPLVVEIQ